MSTTSAHELTKTHFCKTPDCENQAKSSVGRLSYCTHCQIKRGTANADGTPIGYSPATAQAQAAPKTNTQKEASDTHVGRLRAAMNAATRLDRAETAARKAGAELAAARTAHKNAIIAMTAPHGVRHEGDA